jgi:phage tail sheath gpL-like
MGTLVVSIKTSKDTTSFKKTGQPNANLARIISLLTGFQSGAFLGSIDVQSSATDPVAASATATLTYGSLANADTITILGVALTCVTGTPSTDEWKKETDVTTTAVNLVAAINANTTLLKYVTATSALGVVTITVNQKGYIGNYLTDITKSSSGIALAQWASGTGGAETSAVTIRG